ncbi:hypothetical protein [Acidisphaera sp. L21]|uniref:hypothetical protein n=1 Tax=Acidisphaera sp. L21 TaxID=1641851 RepID=UPI00131D433C|nr:hypothetical protein [Acidisphaera sp. L21]
MPLPPALHSSANRPAFWFVALALANLCTESLACWYLGFPAPGLATCLGLLALAVVVAGIMAFALDRLVLATYRQLTADGATAAAEREVLELALAARLEQQRRLRHDIRGVLSPVLLTADRLSNHADPAVKRSGEILSRTVDRATAMLAEAAEAASNPPADP